MLSEVVLPQIGKSQLSVKSVNGSDTHISIFREGAEEILLDFDSGRSILNLTSKCVVSKLGSFHIFPLKGAQYKI